LALTSSKAFGSIELAIMRTLSEHNPWSKLWG